MNAMSPKTVWLAVALGSAGLATASLVLTTWLNLHPCHLCIFQRLLFMLIAGLALVAVFARNGRLAGGATAPLAFLGLGVAGYQSWLQAQPANTLSCATGEPNIIERLVEWLGQQAPVLFLATGSCENEELVILGLSLANWAFVAFLAILLVAAWTVLFLPTRQRAPSL